MKDKIGQDISVGAVVDVYVSDIVSAFVVEVREGGILGPNGPEPALLVLNIAIPIRLRPGQPAPVYLVRQPDKPEQPAERIM